MTPALVTVLTTALAPGDFPRASLDYGALAPVLVISGAALLGVLVEAFVPRRSRYAVQVGLALLGLVAAFVVLVVVSVDHQTATAGLKSAGGAVLGSVIIDGPALFLQGAILVFAVLGVLTMAERLGGTGSDAFTPVGSTTPGSAGEALAEKAGAMTSEVFPSPSSPSSA